MSEQIISSGRGLKQRIGAIPQRINDLMDDPTLGPMLLLAALMSFGFIYLRRSQSINPKEGAILSQSNTEVKLQKNVRKFHHIVIPLPMCAYDLL
ncbi:hypothetical protein Tco_0302746 [Tanacetum coccineum]